MRQVFETLMAGSRSRAPEAVGKAGGSRSSRALLRARSRAVVTPDERQAMETLARQELVGKTHRPKLSRYDCQPVGIARLGC